MPVPPLVRFEYVKVLVDKVHMLANMLPLDVVWAVAAFFAAVELHNVLYAC